MLDLADNLPARRPAPAAETRGIRFSYARPEHPWRKRLPIETIERLTGQPHFKRLYETWSLSRPDDENIFAAAVRLLRLKVQLDGGALSRIPAAGPVLFVANHPFGVLDGVVLGHLTTKVRPDTKILTHSLLCQPREARDYLLPIDFGGTESARATTLLTRRRAQEWLRDGHAIAVFPGGSVATAQNPWTGPALDPPWHRFVAKLARTPGLDIVPVYFHGQNSRLFQLASHINYTLRLALLFRETARRIGTRVQVAIGDPIDARELEAIADRRDLMLELRRRTLALAAVFGDAPDYRQEFRWPAHINWD